MQLPAYCDNCNLLFPSVLSAGLGLVAVGNKQTCPQCGNLANIADFVNGVARLYPKQLYNQKLVQDTLVSLAQKVDDLIADSKARNSSVQKDLDHFIEEKTGIHGFFGRLLHHSKNLKSWVRRVGWKKFLMFMAGSFMLVAGDDIADLIEFDFPVEPIIIELPKESPNDIETLKYE